jgi:hypothetical protein
MFTWYFTLQKACEPLKTKKKNVYCSLGIPNFDVIERPGREYVLACR